MRLKTYRYKWIMSLMKVKLLNFIGIVNIYKKTNRDSLVPLPFILIISYAFTFSRS